MSNSRVYRALDTNMHARADIFGGGLLGDPLSDLPIVGGLSSVLSPVITAIGLPGASTSTAATTTSTKATSTVSLTTSSTAATATSTSATSTSTSATTSAASTSSIASATSTLATSSATATSTQQAVSDTAVATSTAPSAPSNTGAGASLTSSSSSSSASASSTAVADTANAPKGFLANKALSVGVITAASLVGLVLIIAIATWAIRKRKNDRIDRDILDFSTGNLMHDTEKGAGAGGNGSIEGASSTGHGSSSSHGTLSLGPMETSRGMYENRGYPVAAPAYIPRNQPSRMANPYPAQQQQQPAYNTYAFPSQEQNNNTYGNWNNYGGYGNGNPGAMQPQNNQFDQAYSGTEDPYGGIAYDSPQQNGAMAGVGAGAQGQGPVRRPSAHRKPPPQLYIPPNPISEAVVTSAPSPISSVSLTKPPLQPAGGMGAAQPQPTRRTSLLNSPIVEGAPRERKDTLTHVELLDPSAPKGPALSPRLPDEFGRKAAVPASKDSPVEQPVRRLVVRNE